MAIVNNGTVNALPVDRLPSGYTPPIVTTIPDFHWRYDNVVTLTTATALPSSSPVTNMTAIVSSTTTAITSLLAGDFLSTANVTSYSVINGLEFNLGNPSPNYLSNNVTPAYLVSVTTYVKAV